MNNLVALCGYAQVGKDTAAKILSEFSYYRVAFADSLKEDLRGFILTHYGLDVDRVEGKEKEMIRPMLVAHGRIKREMNPNHWVDLAETRMSLIKSIGAADRFVISDLRYPNEAKRVKELGGEVWLVVRTGFHPANEEERASISDIVEAKLYDRFIDNSGSMASLNKQIEEAIK